MINSNLLKMIYSKKIKTESILQRTVNIEAFSQLDKNGLSFGNIERKILLHTTKIGEKIYIQYPGKETSSGNVEKIRLWDFRPKMQLSDGNYIKDLSFPNIWDDLSEIHDNNKNTLEILASIFFKMAFTHGYVKTTLDYPYEDINIKNGEIINKGTITITWYKPNFPDEIMDELQKKIKPIRGASIEAYLYYNDFLVQNEDCKYYYRDVKIKNNKWNSKSGRQNTLLTHISVIEYLQGKITFSEIMTRFQRGMGVAPISLKRVPEVTNNIVTIE